MGLVAVVLIFVWAYGLLCDTGRVLLGVEMDASVLAEIREVIAASPIKAQLVDLHVWRVGKDKYACILSLATDNAVSPEYSKKKSMHSEELVYISVEINAICRWAIIYISTGAGIFATATIGDFMRGLYGCCFA